MDYTKFQGRGGQALSLRLLAQRFLGRSIQAGRHSARCGTAPAELSRWMSTELGRQESGHVAYPRAFFLSALLPKSLLWAHCTVHVPDLSACCFREDAAAALDLYLQHVMTDPELMREEELMRHYLAAILAHTPSRVL